MHLSRESCAVELHHITCMSLCQYHHRPTVMCKSWNHFMCYRHPSVKLFGCGGNGAMVFLKSLIWIIQRAACTSSIRLKILHLPWRQFLNGGPLIIRFVWLLRIQMCPCVPVGQLFQMHLSVSCAHYVWPTTLS